MRLIAHELTHVVQQSGASAGSGSLPGILQRKSQSGALPENSMVLSCLCRAAKMRLRGPTQMRLRRLTQANRSSRRRERTLQSPPRSHPAYKLRQPNRILELPSPRHLASQPLLTLPRIPQTPPRHLPHRRRTIRSCHASRICSLSGNRKQS
jgi:hypothetical protein